MRLPIEPDTDEAEKAWPHPLAQAMELQDRFQRYRIARDLKPGDICRAKPGLAEFKEGIVLMFWRLLDPSDWTDRILIREYLKHHSGASKVDCLIALIDHEGDLIFRPTDKSKLEPFTPEDPEAGSP